MDLVKRILNIVQDRGGVAVYIAYPKPNPPLGFIVLYNTQANQNTDPDIVIKFRAFLLEYITFGSGIAAFRRAGRVIWGNFQFFPNQEEATTFANTNKIQYIFNLETNAAINLGNLEPQFPGDGVAD